MKPIFAFIAGVVSAVLVAVVTVVIVAEKVGFLPEPCLSDATTSFDTNQSTQSASTTAAISTSTSSKAKGYVAPAPVKINTELYGKIPEFSTPEQLENVRTFVGTAVARGLPNKAIKVTAAVPLQEANWKNLPYGHWDSLGTFQQRWKMMKNGKHVWGDKQQVMDPVYATNRFIDELESKISDEDLASMSLMEIGIKVQVPDPDAYARRWNEVGNGRGIDAIVNSVVGNLNGSTYANGDAPQESAPESFGYEDCQNPCFVDGTTTAIDEISVASWNILKSNSVGNVRAGIRTLASRGADVISVQEAGQNSKWNAAKTAVPEEFDMVKDRNAVPILWRRSKLKLLEQGSVHVADFTRVESGAGGRSFSNKNITYAKFEVKSTRSVLYVVNHHLVPTIETKGKPNKKKPKRLALYQKQMEAAFKLIKKFRQQGVVILTMDGNVDARKDARVEDPFLLHSQFKKNGMSSSYQTLGLPKGGTQGKRLIDYSVATNTKAAKAVRQTIISLRGSDHDAIMVTYKGEATAGKSESSASVKPASQQDGSVPPNSSERDDTTDQTDQIDPTNPTDPGCDQQADGRANTNQGAVFSFLEAQRGKRYVMGDGNPNNNTFDCSELTQQAFLEGGVALPRTALQQYRATKKYAVNRSDIQKGDLLFFLSGGIEHVGVYWGNNKMFHAPNPDDRIGVYPLGADDGYYWSRFTGAARPIQHVTALQSEGTSGGWVRPLEKFTTVTSPFSASRWNPAVGGYNIHDGSDYGTGKARPEIRAAAAGKVIKADWDGGYGKYVTISHAGGKVTTGYAHMSEIRVQAGQTVTAGQVIGRVGTTGNSTGMHLHFSVRVKGHKGPSGNGFSDWVNADKFIKNTDGYRDKVLGTRTDFGLAA